MSAVTLQRRVQELIAMHGGLRKAARVVQIDHGYLCRLLSGSKSNPSDSMLRKLGLRISKIVFERTRP